MTRLAVAMTLGALGVFALFATATGPSPEPRFCDDTESPIVASVYSLASAWIEPEEARALLTAIRRHDPARHVAVFAGPGEGAALAAVMGPNGRVLESTRPPSPWPRDPFFLARDAADPRRVILVERPNRQAGREEDATMAPRLAAEPWPEGSPWRGAALITSSEPFHVGQILQTPTTAWLSLHALEPAILSRLGLDRVPVESFVGADGRGRYLAAAQASADALAALLGRPVRFIHPLPDSVEAFGRLGGGAGFDLDSLLTLLPAAATGAPGGGAALLADVDAGRALLERTPDLEFDEMSRRFELSVAGSALRQALLAATSGPRSRGLDSFLEWTAGHLAGAGLPVRRLPVVLVPTALLADRQGVGHEDFLLGWNNVVVERRDARTRAEGFLLPWASGNAVAEETFRAAGVELHLFPLLRRSVVLNGGYRCASNHLRRLNQAVKH